MYLMCDDIESAISELRNRGCKTTPIHEERWGACRRSPFQAAPRSESTSHGTSWPSKRNSGCKKSVTGGLAKPIVEHSQPARARAEDGHHEVETTYR
jgi:hypothetical protein